MNLDFSEIFKKAEFNTLMISIAIAAWVLNYCVLPNNVLILGIAIASTTYCIIRLIVYLYNNIQISRERAKNKIQEVNDLKRKNEQIQKEREIEISRMFYGLSDYNKNCLACIVLKGKKDQYEENVFQFNRYSHESLMAQQASSISLIYRDSLDDGDECIWIRTYTDTITAEIDPYLLSLIKKYLCKN